MSAKYRIGQITVALLLAMSAANPVLADGAKFTDEQLSCVGSATKEYLTANAQFVQHAIDPDRALSAGGPLMSVDDQIAQRRLVEGYCKQYAACLVSNISGDMKETVLRATFGSCLENEAKEK